MITWIDDGLICSTRQYKLNDIVGYLSQKFRNDNWNSGQFHRYQDYSKSVDENNLFYSGILHFKNPKKFQMDGCNSRAVPDDPFIHLAKNTQDENDEEFPYREAVGYLIFALTCTRPDIAYAVNQLAQFSNKPSRAH